MTPISGCDALVMFSRQAEKDPDFLGYQLRMRGLADEDIRNALGLDEHELARLKLCRAVGSAVCRYTVEEDLANITQGGGIDPAILRSLLGISRE